MVFLRHRRGDLLGFEREVGPDMRLTTAVEMLGEGRTISGHRLLMSALSFKMASRISMLGPGEVFVVGSRFRFTTLDQALSLLYAGHIHLEEDDSADVIDLLDSWRAQGRPILCSHIGGPARSS